MASFCTTFNSMLRQDIKHTHFGRPLILQYRSSSEYPNLEQLRRMETDRLLKQRILRGKSSMYNNHLIPAAPAFRVVSRYDLDDIIGRLRKPTVASQGIEETSDVQCVQARRDSSPRFLGLTKLSPRNQEVLTARLVTPNHAAKLRAEKDPYRMITVVNKPIPSDSIVVASVSG